MKSRYKTEINLTENKLLKIQWRIRNEENKKQDAKKTKCCLSSISKLHLISKLSNLNKAFKLVQDNKKLNIYTNIRMNKQKQIYQNAKCFTKKNSEMKSLWKRFKEIHMQFTIIKPWLKWREYSKQSLANASMF